MDTDSRGRLKDNYSLEDLSQYFHLPINEAAKRLSICCTSLKKLCRKHGIKRWPHRKIKSLDKAIAKLEDMKSLADQKQRVKHQLFNIRTALMRNPEIVGNEGNEGTDAEDSDNEPEDVPDVPVSGEESRAAPRHSESSSPLSACNNSASARQLPSVRDLLNMLDDSPAPAGGASFAHGTALSAPVASSSTAATARPASSSASETPAEPTVEPSFGDSFHRLFGLSLMPCGVLATSGQFITANSALQTMLGYREPDLRLRSSLAALASLEDRESVTSSLRNLISGNVNSLQWGLRLVHRNGHLIWALTNITLVRDGQNNPSYFVATFQDLNALQKSCFGLDMSSMKQMTEQLRCAFDFAAVAIVLLTPEGRVQLANPYACNLFGYGTEEFMGRSVDDITHPDDTHDGLDLRSALNSCNASSNFLFNRRLLDKQGHIVRAHIMLYRRLDSYGRPEFYIAQIKPES